MFIVTVINNEYKWYLKSTTWTGFLDRADKFMTEQEARDAAKRAEKFMHPRIKRNYKIDDLTK